MTLKEAYRKHARACAICQEAEGGRTLRESSRPRARLAEKTRLRRPSRGRLAPPLAEATLVSEQTGVPVMPEGTAKADDPALAFDNLYDRTPFKMSKEDVNYRYASDPSKSCSACVNFIEPGACEKVAGLIRLVDTCDLFTPATARQVFRSSYEAETRAHT